MNALRSDMSRGDQVESSTPCPIDEAAKAYVEYHIGMYIQWTYTPLVVIIGLVGNSLSFIIMNKKCNRHVSCCLYLCVLAVSDSALLLGYFSFWIGGVVFASQSDILCKTMVWIFNWFSSSSNSLIVCVTLDRYLAICWPLRWRWWRTRCHAKRICACIIIFTCVFNIPNLWASKLVGPYVCAAFADGQMFSRIYSFIHTFIFSVVAFILIIILNSCIVKAVHARKNNTDKIKTYDNSHIDKASSVQKQTVETNIDEDVLTRTQDGTTVVSGESTLNIDRQHGQINYNGSVSSHPDVQSNHISRLSSRSCVGLLHCSGLPSTHSYKISSRSFSSMYHCTSLPSQYQLSYNISIKISNSLDRQLVVMLVAVCFAFLLLTLPQFIRYIVYTLVDNTYSAATYAQYVLFYNLTNKLHMTNNAINFYVYCLTGSKFRKDFNKMLECFLRKRHTVNN